MNATTGVVGVFNLQVRRLRLQLPLSRAPVNAAHECTTQFTMLLAVGRAACFMTCHSLPTCLHPLPVHRAPPGTAPAAASSSTTRRPRSWRVSYTSCSACLPMCAPALGQALLLGSLAATWLAAPCCVAARLPPFHPPTKHLITLPHSCLCFSACSHGAAHGCGDVQGAAGGGWLRCGGRPGGSRGSPAAGGGGRSADRQRPAAQPRQEQQQQQQ